MKKEIFSLFKEIFKDQHIKNLCAIWIEKEDTAIITFESDDHIEIDQMKIMGECAYTLDCDVKIYNLSAHYFEKENIFCNYKLELKFWN